MQKDNPQSAAEFVENLMDDVVALPRGSGISISGKQESIDEYLANSKADPERINNLTSVRPKSGAKDETLRELEGRVRVELSDMNRKERRAWLSRQSRAAGKVRARVLTVQKAA